MIKLIYFDFNFWRIDILRLCLSFSKVPYEYERVPRNDWLNKKETYPFGQLPVLIANDIQYGHTHALAIYCAKKSSLYDNNEYKELIINQVLDWANEITNLIAPSIRAATREKDFDKSKRLRKEFIKKDLYVWFSFLEKLLKKSSSNNRFFTDKFSIADITAWRIILWFCSGKLDSIDEVFLERFTILKQYYLNINNYEPFKILDEFREITQNY